MRWPEFNVLVNIAIRRVAAAATKDLQEHSAFEIVRLRKVVAVHTTALPHFVMARLRVPVTDRMIHVID